MNPYLFVVGCPRSGTTLLQRMLDAHPDVAVINETLWITREAERRKGLTPEGFVTSELVSRLFEYPRFRRLDISRQEVERLLEADAPVPYPRFVSRIFDLYGRNRGKRLVGDKSPGYVRELSTLHRLWPEARFVHLIRDGRDIWLSVAGWKKADRSVGQFATWAQDPLTTTALWWERSIRLGRETGTSLGPALYGEVRYEDLVKDPAGVCRSLCGFLGISYDDGMLRYHEGRTRRETGLTAKRAWLPPVAGLRDWRAQMPVEDVERFEATAGELLDELGYRRAIPHPPAAVRERAAGIRSAFTKDARDRGRALPARWRA
jgi:Sulfotransferase family